MKNLYYLNIRLDRFSFISILYANFSRLCNFPLNFSFNSFFTKLFLPLFDTIFILLIIILILAYLFLKLGLFFKDIQLSSNGIKVCSIEILNRECILLLHAGRHSFIHLFYLQLHLLLLHHQLLVHLFESIHHHCPRLRTIPCPILTQVNCLLKKGSLGVLLDDPDLSKTGHVIGERGSEWSNLFYSPSP